MVTTIREDAQQPLGERDEHGRSLLRLYRELGRASSYRAVLEALRSEMRQMLGYEDVWLQLVGAAGGTPSAWPD